MTTSRKATLAGISVTFVALVLVLYRLELGAVEESLDSAQHSSGALRMEPPSRTNRPANRSANLEVRIESIRKLLNDTEGWSSIETWLYLSSQEDPDQVQHIFDELLKELEIGSFADRSNKAANLATMALWMQIEKNMGGADEKLFATVADELLPSLEESWLPAVTPGDAGNPKYHWTFETMSKMADVELSKDRRAFLLRFCGAASVVQDSQQMVEFVDSLPPDEQDTFIGEIRDVELAQWFSSTTN